MSDERKERLVRPVKCHFCNEPMLFFGDERHEPEVTVVMEAIEGKTRFYAHVRCWNARMT